MYIRIVLYNIDKCIVINYEVYRLPPLIEAFLDIETTGSSPENHEITVVGIQIESGIDSKLVQLVGREISAANIIELLEGVDTIYTYNGSRFDLPFIYTRLQVNLAKEFKHCDLMYHCWKNKLYGGLKSVEQQLGIERKLTEINGYEAVRLWWRYVESFDLDALNALLEYNKEDVLNLKILKEKLDTGLT